MTGLEHKYLFYFHTEHLGNIIGQFQGRIVFSFLQEDDGFTPYPYFPGQLRLSQVIAGPKFLNPFSHGIYVGTYDNSMMINHSNKDR